MKQGKILVVDDNAGIRSALTILLPLHFGKVEAIASPNLIAATLGTFQPDVVLLDMNFFRDINTGNEGLYWLSEIKRMSPDVEVILFTAYADISLAVEGMKRGAFDFIVKPWDNDKLIATLQQAVDKRLAAGRADRRRSDEAAPEPTMFWGNDPTMTDLRRTVGKIAPTDASVLITGENGSGKDILAAEIHRLSERHNKPMVCVDVGAITDSLFESELFGHVKGAFTDAHTDHTGKIEQANDSTLFLDEIGNIPLHLQAKLLRALQNRAVTRVGDTHTRPVNIRLICATNKNIEQMVQNGTFREDLYYRINTIHLHLPPLRERKDEILPLANMFLRRFAQKYHRPVEGFTADAQAALEACPWNGNIRELQNCIEKAVIMADGAFVDVADCNLREQMQQPAPDVNSTPTEMPTLDQIEENTIRDALNRCGGNLTHVAKMLNISRPTLYAKLKKYDI